MLTKEEIYMKIQIGLISLLLINAAVISHASDNENTTNAISGTDLHCESTKCKLLTNSYAEIAQDGTTNQAKITQFNKNEIDGSNRACIVQGGDQNSAVIEQTGEDNTNIILQCGKSNSGIQKTDGNRNLASLVQFGYYNRSVQVISGNDQSNIIVQRGSDNQIYREETGQAGLGYRVLQEGNGMRMTVINGR
jgi:hypothetical protein